MSRPFLRLVSNFLMAAPMRLATLLVLAATTPVSALRRLTVCRAQRVDAGPKGDHRTVEPVHELAARARIGGTVASLSVTEGDQVEAGSTLAVVADPKLVLQSRRSTPASSRCNRSATRRRPTMTA